MDLKQYGLIREKIKAISNSFRFKIIIVTQDNEMTITQLSSKLRLSYTKCADYITMLEKYNLVSKTKDGKNVLVKSKIKINQDSIIF